MLKYFPGEHLHLNGAGPKQLVPCVKNLHSLSVDELKHV
jgi:hypothetical protein